MKKRDKDDNNLYLEEHWLQLNFLLVILVESRLQEIIVKDVIKLLFRQFLYFFRAGDISCKISVL